MPQQKIIQQLEKNYALFKDLLSNTSREEYLWKTQADKWCLLEIICHLRDEEVEDFRTRIKCMLEKPGTPPPAINPVAWGTDRKYLEQDYNQVLENFLSERKASVHYLQSLPSPNWANSYQHNSLGELSAAFFLSNWLAHDYLHLRQITRLKYDYLQSFSGIDLSYAGNWI